MKRRASFILFIFLGGILSFGYWAMVPPLWIEKTNTGVRIRVETLGEYNSALTQLAITDVATNVVVVRLVPKNEIIGMWYLDLRAGRNNLDPDLQVPKTKDPGYYVETPAGASFVNLAKGSTYEVRVTGKPILGEVHLAKTEQFAL